MANKRTGKDVGKANRRLVGIFSLVFVGMFGFSFALIPLYDALCDITGLNGKTGRINATEAAATEIDTERWVTVEFLSRVNSGLPWEFRPRVRRMRVHPGELSEAVFVAVNTSDQQTVGQAVPSMVPNLASRYFNKTECFCFTSQVLEAKESKDMPLRFVIDPALPDNITSVALSYTFYESKVAVLNLE